MVGSGDFEKLFQCVCIAVIMQALSVKGDEERCLPV